MRKVIHHNSQSDVEEMKNGAVVIKRNGIVSNASDIMQQVKFWFDNAFNGDYVLVFEKVKKPRTNDQNALMWVWFGQMAESFSMAYGEVYTAQMMHDFLTQKFLPIKMPDGSYVGRSTKSLTQEEMTKFLNDISVFASSKGITLVSINDPAYPLIARKYSK